MKTKTIPPMHPGQMIKEDFLGDYGLTQSALAKALNIPQSRLTELIKGRRSITADTAVRLGKFFGNSPGFWLNLQTDFDLRMVDSKRIAQEVTSIAA